MSDVYRSDGVENFRAAPTFREHPDSQTTPSGSGKPAGGLANVRAQNQTFRKAPNSLPNKGSGPKPPESFRDDCV